MNWRLTASRGVSKQNLYFCVSSEMSATASGTAWRCLDRPIKLSPRLYSVESGLETGTSTAG